MTDELCWMLNTCAEIKHLVANCCNCILFVMNEQTQNRKSNAFILTIPRNFPTFGVCLCYICGLAESLFGTSQLILYFDHGMNAIPSVSQSCSLSSSN